MKLDALLRTSCRGRQSRRGKRAGVRAQYLKGYACGRTQDDLAEPRRVVTLCRAGFAGRGMAFA